MLVINGANRGLYDGNIQVEGYHGAKNGFGNVERKDVSLKGGAGQLLLMCAYIARNNTKLCPNHTELVCQFFHVGFD